MLEVDGNKVGSNNSNSESNPKNQNIKTNKSKQ